MIRIRIRIFKTLPLFPRSNAAGLKNAKIISPSIQKSSKRGFQLTSWFPRYLPGASGRKTLTWNLSTNLQNERLEFTTGESNTLQQGVTHLTAVTKSNVFKPRCNELICYMWQIVRCKHVMITKQFQKNFVISFGQKCPHAIDVLKIVGDAEHAELCQRFWHVWILETPTSSSETHQHVTFSTFKTFSEGLSLLCTAFFAPNSLPWVLHICLHISPVTDPLGPLLQQRSGEGGGGGEGVGGLMRMRKREPTSGIRGHAPLRKFEI